MSGCFLDHLLVPIYFFHSQQNISMKSLTNFVYSGEILGIFISFLIFSHYILIRHYLLKQTCYNQYMCRLKSDANFPQNCVVSFIESFLKMMKNAFYFILKAPFALMIFKFLPWLFGHVEKKKKAWLGR